MITITLTFDPVLFWLLLGLLLMLVSGMWIWGRGDDFGINKVWDLTWRHWMDRWMTLVLAIGGIATTGCLLIVLAMGLSTLV